MTIAQRTDTPAVVAKTQNPLVVQPKAAPPLLVQGARVRPRRRHIGLLLGIFLVLLAGGGWMIWQAQPIKVTTARPHFGPAVALIYASGFVEPQHPVSVAARITAPVLNVWVDEGDRVRRGEPLVQLESEQQKGLVAQAVAQRRQAVLDEGRKLTLFSQGWVTRAERDQAVATADAARAVERSARGQLDQYVVRSQINGVVLKRDVEPGNLATPTSTLFILGDPRRTRVTATIDERDVPLVQLGQKALMKNDAWPERVLHGHVSELTPSGDPTQRAFRARLLLDDRVSLPLGMTLEVNIVTQKNDHALLVPASAVRDGQIWIIREGRAQPLPVRTGIIGPDTVEITAGLHANETIILQPPATLRPGQRVRSER